MLNVVVCVCVCVCVCSDIQRVLQEDREKLRLLHKSQPRFSEEQKKELFEVHPWMKKGRLPKAIDVKVEWEFKLNSFDFSQERNIKNDRFASFCLIVNAGNQGFSQDGCSLLVYLPFFIFKKEASS